MKYEIPKEWLASKAHLEDGVSLEAGCLISPLTLLTGVRAAQAKLEEARWMMYHGDLDGAYHRSGVADAYLEAVLYLLTGGVEVGASATVSANVTTEKSDLTPPTGTPKP